MRFRTTLLMLTVASCSQLFAAPPAIQEAYEVRVRHLTLPANEFGSLILRQCDDCDRVTLRVEGETSYVFDGQAMALEAFRKAVLNMAARDEAVGTVIYRLEDNRAQKVTVDPVPETIDRRTTDTRG